MGRPLSNILENSRCITGKTPGFWQFWEIFADSGSIFWGIYSTGDLFLLAISFGFLAGPGFWRLVIRHEWHIWQTVPLDIVNCVLRALKNGL